MPAMFDWTREYDVWTTSEIAARLRCTPRSVRGWCRDGLLDHYRIGSDYRVDAAALRRFLTGSASRAA